MMVEKKEVNEVLIFKENVWADTDARWLEDMWLFLEVDCSGESNEDLWWDYYWL